MLIGEKWLLVGKMYQSARVLHAAGVRLRNPDATDLDVRNDWMVLTLGKELADKVIEAAGESTR